MMCKTCRVTSHVKPFIHGAGCAGLAETASRIVNLRPVLDRNEVLRIAAACQTLSERAAQKHVPEYLGGGNDLGARRSFRQVTGYSGSYICFDNMLATMLFPYESLMGELFPEPLRDVCDQLDDMSDYYAKKEKTSHEETAALFAQLAQLLLELVE